MGFNVMTGLIRFTLNVGLMKPRRGFTLVAGKENPGRERFLILIDKKSMNGYDFRDRLS